ncbi:MAG: MATE family efflux transporter [Clostridiales bacterium]|nr:MATE family efflux transporter [Clostridiales bacterium]
MNHKNSFFASVCSLAVPVALQSMLQASFSIVDQIMIGQLGSVSVAGVGLAGKFASIYSVIVSAVGVVAGIMISQYLGQKNQREVRRSFFVNLLIALGLACVFTLLCGGFPSQIMGLYTTDVPMGQAAAAYLRIITATFLPIAGATMLSTLLRCLEKAQLPLYASIASAVLNTGLNYVLIFGRLGLPAMGASGAAIATVISTWVSFLLMLAMLGRNGSVLNASGRAGKFNLRQYLAMLLPILVCEFLWSLGENIYAAIYGHMGTEASAAMMLINPIQSLVIGALCGLSQAASVIIGKKLGSKEYDEAYRDSWRLIRYGFIGSVILSALVVATSPMYVEIYQVDAAVKLLTRQILLAYALVAPFKVLNMIAGGGVIRSGGKTNYVMFIDMIGTWVFGVPLGLLSAFVWKLPIPYVYFLLSLEECVRFAITVVILRSKRWMQSLKG